MDIHTIFNADPTGSQLVDFAQRTAEQLKYLNRTQIRTIFAEARRIETMWSTDTRQAIRRLNLLKPKLDYQARRNSLVKPLRYVLTQAIDEVEKASTEAERKERFERFMDLFEAIVAYHRSKSSER